MDTVIMLQEQERMMLAEDDDDIADMNVPKKSWWKRAKKRRYQNKLENWEKCDVSKVKIFFEIIIYLITYDFFLEVLMIFLIFFLVYRFFIVCQPIVSRSCSPISNEGIYESIAQADQIRIY